MKAPKPPGGTEDFWAWVVLLAITHMTATGLGIAWGEAEKGREFRDTIRKQREEKENAKQR